jgi:hypothetical protein
MSDSDAIVIVTIVTTIAVVAIVTVVLVIDVPTVAAVSLAATQLKDDNQNFLAVWNFRPTDQWLKRERFITQLYLHIWLGGCRCC